MGYGPEQVGTHPFSFDFGAFLFLAPQFDGQGACDQSQAEYVCCNSAEDLSEDQIRNFAVCIKYI